MRIALPAAAFVIVLLGSLAGVQAAEIPDIKSVADLPGLAPIALADGWNVRIGLGDSGPAGAQGPWKMLYCLAEAPAWDREGIRIKGVIPGEILGPVFYSCSWDEQKTTARGNISAAGELSKSGKEVFYAVIPLAWKGVCHIRVMNRAGEVLLSKDITVAEEPVCYWQTFVQSDYRPPGDGPWPLALAPVAAVPVADGMWSHRWADFGPATQPATPGTLSVQLEQGCFVVHAEHLQRATNLLARWWVNDKAVIPARSEKEMATMDEGDGLTQEMKIAFGLPSVLGRLHVGDRVDLQLLYVPGGFRLLLAKSGPSIMQFHLAAKLEMPALPVLSNRMTFVITEELLAAGQRR